VFAAACLRQRKTACESRSSHLRGFRSAAEIRRHRGGGVAPRGRARRARTRRDALRLGRLGHRGRLEYVHATERSVDIGQMSAELEHVLACLSRADEFDLIHDHSGLLALTVAASVRTPFVHTAHGPMLGHSGVLYRSALRFNPAASLISLTRAQRRGAPHLPWIANCPNAIEVDRFPFRDGHDDTSPSSAACLRRRARARRSPSPATPGCRCGSPRSAASPPSARTSTRTSARIWATGSSTSGSSTTRGRPSSSATSCARRADRLGGALRARLRGGRRVWDAGRGHATRVGARGRGRGRDRFCLRHARTMVEALGRVDALDRRAIRTHAERRFTPERMVDDYLDAYALAVGDVDQPVALTA
jgi:hypothetical protein